MDGAAVTSESLITESVIDEYDRYGAVCLRRAFVPEWQAEIDEHEILSWDLELGDCIAFSGLVLHGVMPTEHSRTSRRFSTRWAGDAVFFSRGGSAREARGRPA